MNEVSTLILIKIGFQKTIDNIFKANFYEISYYSFRKKIILSILHFASFL